MIRSKTKNQLLIILLAVGFFIGILYENVVGSMKVFQTEYLRMFYEMTFDVKKYLFYILKMRMLPLIGVVLLWDFKWRKGAIRILTICCGFFFGRLFVSAILWQGIKGIGICIAALFPHMLFYTFAYLMLILHLYNDRRRQWNKLKTTVFFIVFVLGMGCEVYINPQIVKIVIGWI